MGKMQKIARISLGGEKSARQISQYKAGSVRGAIGVFGVTDCGAGFVILHDSSSSASKNAAIVGSGNHHRSELMLTYREARRSGKVNVNPARDVRHRHEDNSRERYLNQFEPARTDVDYLKFLKTGEARLRAVVEHDYPEHLPEFELALNTGLCKGSMYSLTWAMVDWTGRDVEHSHQQERGGAPHSAEQCGFGSARECPSTRRENRPRVPVGKDGRTTGQLTALV